MLATQESEPSEQQTAQLEAEPLLSGDVDAVNWLEYWPESEFKIEGVGQPPGSSVMEQQFGLHDFALAGQPRQAQQQQSNATLGVPLSSEFAAAGEGFAGLDFQVGVLWQLLLWCCWG